MTIRAYVYLFSSPLSCKMTDKNLSNCGGYQRSPITGGIYPEAQSKL